MPQLAAIRYIDVGPPNARCRDLYLDCSDGIQSLDTTVWLRNGGGKSSLLALLLSMLAPRKAAFLSRGTSGEHKMTVASFAAPGELGVVAAEWLLDGPAGAPPSYLVTLQALALDTSSGERSLTRWFALARCGGGSALQSIRDVPDRDPIDPTCRLTLPRLREWFGRLREQTPDSAAAWTEDIGGWERQLRDYRLDADLFYTQAAMNETEGGADVLLEGAHDDQGFAAMCLNLLYAGHSAAKPLTTFRTLVNEGAAAMRRRSTILAPEHAVLGELVAPLSTLAQLADAERFDHQSNERALQPIVDWAHAVPRLVDDATEALATHEAVLQAHITTKERLVEDRSMQTRQSAFLRLTVAQRRRERASAELARTRDIVKGAHERERQWRVASLVAAAARAARDVGAAQAVLDAAAEGAAPLRAHMEMAAARARAVCHVAIASLEADQLVAAGHYDACRIAEATAQTDATLAEAALRNDDARLATALDRRRVMLADRERLKTKRVWPEGHTWADARLLAETQRNDADEHLLEIRDAEAARLETERHARVAENRLREVASGHRNTLATVTTFTKHRATAIATVAALPHWSYVDGGAGPETSWTADRANDLLQLASEADRHSTQYARQHGAALDARDALASGDRLPDPAGVRAVASALRDANIRAQSAWAQLADMPGASEHLAALLIAWPALTTAIVIDDADWERATAALASSSFVGASASLDPLWTCRTSDLLALYTHASSTTSIPLLLSGTPVVAPLGDAIWRARVSPSAGAAASRLLSDDLETMERAHADRMRRSAALRHLASALTTWVAQFGTAAFADMEQRRLEAETALAHADTDLREIDRSRRAREAQRTHDIERSTMAEQVRRTADTALRDLDSFQRHGTTDLTALDEEVHRAETLRRTAALEAQRTAAVADTARVATARAQAQLPTLAAALGRLTTTAGRVPDARVPLPVDALDLTPMTPEEAVEAFDIANHRYLREAAPSALADAVDAARQRERLADASATAACEREHVARAAVNALLATLPAGKAVESALTDATDAHVAAGQAHEQARDVEYQAKAEEKEAIQETTHAGGTDGLTLPTDHSDEALLTLATVYDHQRTDTSKRLATAISTIATYDQQCGQLRDRRNDLEATLAVLGSTLATASALDLLLPVVNHSAAALLGGLSSETIAPLVATATETLNRYQAERAARRTARMQAQRTFTSRVTRADAMQLPMESVVRKLHRMSDDELAASAPTQLQDVTVRLATLTAELALADDARMTLIKMAIQHGRDGVNAIQAFCRHTRLPDGLDYLSGATLVRCDIKAATEDVAAAACGRLIDEWCTPERTASAPRVADMIAALVRAQCLAMSFKILRPDLNRPPRPEPPHQVAFFSNGEKLTVVTVIYCALARTRADVLSLDASIRHTGILLYDNPFGKASREMFVAMQRRIAKALNIQLIYWTGIDSMSMLAHFPNVVHLSNSAVDTKTQRAHIRNRTTTPISSLVRRTAHLAVDGLLPFLFASDPDATAPSAPTTPTEPPTVAAALTT